MKKILSLLICIALAFTCVCLIANNDLKTAKAEVYTVTDYNGLSNAFAKAGAGGEVTVYISGEIVVEENISVKGNVTVIGDSSAVLLMNTSDKKTGFDLKKNCYLSLKNLTVKRTFADESERFVFSAYELNSSLYFEEVTFDIQTLDVASINYDRITYCSSSSPLTLTMNNCTYLTDAYFYRGTMVFYNCDGIPQTGGSPTVYDFTSLKIDYQTGKLSFSADITVSQDENFVSIVKNGASFESESTYYVQKDGYTFSFTTKKLKMETPNRASLVIDYANETLSFGKEYAVSKKEDFSTTLNSGDSIAPGETLYVKRVGSGIFTDSETFEFTLPEKEPAIQTTCAFVCEFGFALNHFKGCEYKINGGEYQDSPVFIGLESATEYTVTVRVKATKNSFTSEEYTFTVTTNA